MALIVSISGGDQAPRTVEITGDEIVLGKHSACDVVLADPSVSRRHARVALDGDGLVLEDLGSTNGTTLAGKAVSSPSPVSPTDEIVVGPFRLRVERRGGGNRAEATVVEARPEVAAAADTVPPAAVRTAPPAPEPRPAGIGAPLGPLTALCADDTVSEVMVNGPDEVFVERRGKLELTDVCFASVDELVEVIRGIAAAVGRVIDASQPMLDARLVDGSRANAILTPLAVRGPYLTIRRFPANRLSAAELVQVGALSEPMLEFLRAAVSAHLTLLVSGGTGSGKTTLLNALCGFVGAGERIITIEDAAELRLPQRHVLPLETRPPDALGQGEITIRDLVRNALRMRPDRIVVGEVRGGEALDMLQAMNTGHEGSLSTIHANSPREALSRLETLSLFAGTELPARAIRDQIVGAIRLVVQVGRDAEGRRRVSSITELTGMEGDQFTMGEVFRWESGGDDGPAHHATGYIPRCREKMRERGERVDNAWFQP